MSSRVKDIIGISELDLVTNHKHNRKKFIEECDNELYFVNSENGIITPIGNFQTLSIEELENLIEEIEYKGKNNNKNINCEFLILDNIDIGSLQSTLKTTDKAMIQVASNFNCLEVPNIYTYPDNGHLVDNAHTDKTQGPAACFGPLAAYLYRTHFIFNEKQTFSGQTKEKQINLLENVNNYFGIPRNGKLYLSGNENEINDIDKISKKIKIGLHNDVRILYGRSEVILQQPYQKIDQCFNSTINMKNYGKTTSKENIINITKSCLRAAYNGVFLSAILRQSEILFLTLIGGGSFNNPINLILDEMMSAYLKWANHPKSKLKKVVLCLYKPEPKINDYISKNIIIKKRE
jgi:hypothetical protein